MRAMQEHVEAIVAHPPRKKGKKGKKRKNKKQIKAQALSVLKTYSGQLRIGYAVYLATPWWQRRRKEAIKRAGGKCRRCGRVNRLQVHHKTYERLGCELDADLLVLCRMCHRKEHGLK